MQYYSAVERNGVLRHVTAVDEPLKQYARRKMSDTKGHIVYDFIYMKHSE